MSTAKKISKKFKNWFFKLSAKNIKKLLEMKWRELLVYLQFLLLKLQWIFFKTGVFTEQFRMKQKDIRISNSWAES